MSLLAVGLVVPTLFAQEQTSAPSPATSAPAKRPRHVFTNEDISPSKRSAGSSISDMPPDLRSTSDAAAQYFIKDPITAVEVEKMHNSCHGIVYNGKTRTKESLGKEYLTDYNYAPFPGRAEWEARLFEVHQEIVKATEAYDEELLVAAAENRELLLQTRFSNGDLQRVGALRARLIENWQPVRNLTAKFVAIVREGRGQAGAWLKTHPQTE
jgi:hypothetical protein